MNGSPNKSGQFDGAATVEECGFLTPRNCPNEDLKGVKDCPVAFWAWEKARDRLQEQQRELGRVLLGKPSISLANTSKGDQWVWVVSFLGECCLKVLRSALIETIEHC